MENLEKIKESLNIRGFSRVQITHFENGKEIIDGDSGEVLLGPNQVTNDGFREYLVLTLMGNAGSKNVGWVALGTGTMPGAAHTTLNGEVMDSTQRLAVTTGSITSTTAQFTATFESSDNFLSAQYNLRNIGLFANSTTNETLFAGNTYDSSTCDTNQNVNVTYQIQFS